MNRLANLRQLNSLYLTVIIFVLALFGLYWFLTHSFLAVRVEPTDAVVTLDNAPLNTGPDGTVRKVLAPGKYSLRVEADGYIAHIENLNLSRLQNKKIVVDLKETPRATTLAENAKFLSAGPDFSTIYYLGDSDRTLFRGKVGLSEDKKVQIKNVMALTEPKLSGIAEIIWSPNRELALFRKKDGVYLFDFKKYDFVNQTETLWGKNIGSIAWAPDNAKIAYFLEENGEKSLVFSNIANSEKTRVANLAEMGIDNPLLHWSPDSEWLIVTPRSKSDFNSNKIYLFNAYSRTFKTLTETGSQIDGLFSPDNNKLLYSTYSADPKNPIHSVISVMNKDGSDQRSLDLRAELRKAIWKKDGKTLVVASYNEEKRQESLFGFNIETKAKTDFSISAVEQGYINNLAISDDEKILIFETQKGIFGLKIE